MFEAATRRQDAATEDVRVERQAFTDDSPVTMGMLLSIARDAHRAFHMPGAPPSLAGAYVEAIEERLRNRWQRET